MLGALQENCGKEPPPSWVSQKECIGISEERQFPCHAQRLHGGKCATHCPPCHRRWMRSRRASTRKPSRCPCTASCTPSCVPMSTLGSRSPTQVPFSVPQDFILIPQRLVDVRLLVGAICWTPTRSTPSPSISTLFDECLSICGGGRERTPFFLQKRNFRGALALLLCVFLFRFKIWFQQEGKMFGCVTS